MFYPSSLQECSLEACGLERVQTPLVSADPVASILAHYLPSINLLTILDELLFFTSMVPCVFNP